MAHEQLRSTTVARALTDVVGDFTDLLQKELQLARAEISANFAAKLHGGLWIAIATVFAGLALLLALQALVFGIASYGVAIHWSCLIVAGTTAVLAALAFLVGRTDARPSVHAAKNHPSTQTGRELEQGAVNMSMHSDTRDGGAGWLIGAVKKNPEGLLLLAAGCALLMRSTNPSRRRDFGGRDSRNDLSQAARVRRDRTVGERLSETVQRAGDYVSDVSGSVAETASNYASSVSNYADDVARRAAEQTGHLAQQAQSTLQNTISRVVQEQPLAVALAGIAAGAVVAAAFPVSEIENRTLGTTGEQLREAAGKAGEQLKEATSKAGQRLAAAADERGLNTEGLKEVARDVGEAFSDALEKEDANQTARSGARTSSTKSAQSSANINQRGPAKKGGPN